MRYALVERGWSEEEVDEAANYLYEPGISVLGPALAAAEAELVTAMHDPTEGGVATGLWELADASGVRVGGGAVGGAGDAVDGGGVRGVRAGAAGYDRVGAGWWRRLHRRMWMRCWVCGGGIGVAGASYWARFADRGGGLRVTGGETGDFAAV